MVEGRWRNGAHEFPQPRWRGVGGRFEAPLAGVLRGEVTTGCDGLSDHTAYMNGADKAQWHGGDLMQMSGGSLVA